MARIQRSVLYSLLIFFPILLLLMLPVPCLGSECILMTSARLMGSTTLEPGGLAGFCAWALGPLLAAVVIFAFGLVAYRLTGKPHTRRSDWIAVWALFSLAAYLVAWYAVILVTSIGASETPPGQFLAITALMALAVIGLGQPLALLWLSLVDKIWKAHRQGEATGGQG